MSIIIHGATGAQGGPLFEGLLSSGKTVLAAVREPAKSEGKPSVVVDNGSVDSLVNAYRNADGVFFHLPQAPEPIRVQYAENFVQAIKGARPGRVVISTSGAIIDQPRSSLQVAEDSAIGVLVRGVRESGLSHAIVAPRLYLENLLLPIVLNGVKQSGVLSYPIRSDLPVSWSSHFDIAEVAERLLTDDTVTGVVGVGQLPGLKGADLADGFSAKFGRPVQFEAQSPEDFRKQLEPMFGPAATNIAAFYQALAEISDNVIAEQTSAQRVLGLNPRSVGTWLAGVLA